MPLTRHEGMEGGRGLLKLPCAPGYTWKSAARLYSGQALNLLFHPGQVPGPLRPLPHLGNEDIGLHQWFLTIC